MSNEDVRKLIDALRAPEDLPSAESMAQMQEKLTASLKPVKPLPTDGRMTGFALLLFVLFVNAVTVVLGYQGFQSFNTSQRFWYYATILLLAILFARTTVTQMIPGSKQRGGIWIPIGGSILLLALVVPVLFQRFDTASFVRLGIPCLRLGIISGALSSAFAWLFVRKGLLTSPLQAGTLVAAFGGLAGVGVLALHCPLQNATHIIVWHLGAIAICALAGTLVAAWLSRRP